MSEDKAITKKLRFITIISNSKLSENAKIVYIEFIMKYQADLSFTNKLLIEKEKIVFYTKFSDHRVITKYDINNGKVFMFESSHYQNDEYYYVRKYNSGQSLIYYEESYAGTNPNVTISTFVDGKKDKNEIMNFSGMPSNRDTSQYNFKLERFKKNLAAAITKAEGVFIYVSLYNVDNDYMNFMEWLEVYARWAGYTITKQPNGQYHNLCINPPK